MFKNSLQNKIIIFYQDFNLTDKFKMQLSYYFNQSPSTIILFKAMRHQKKRYSMPRSKYAKIPLKTKLKFLRKIIIEGFSIRDSATIYDINYSTAKTLMRQYRADSFQFDLNHPLEQQFPEWDGFQKRVRCSYRSVQIQSEAKQELTQLSDHSGTLNMSENGVAMPFISNSVKVETNVKQLRLFTSKAIEIISSISFE